MARGPVGGARLAVGRLALLVAFGCTGHKAGDTDGREDPQPDTAVGRRRWAFVEAGDRLTCGIDLRGRAECWGLEGVDGGSDTGPGGTYYDYSALLPPALSFQTIALGMSWWTYDSGNHACGLLTGGGVACWGHERTSENDPPAEVFVQVEADGGTSWGVTPEGELRCWGECPGWPAGQYRSVSQVYGYGAALDTAGDVWSWMGFTTPGALVRGPFEVATGGELSCGILGDGSLRCWWGYAPDKAVPPDYMPAGAFTQVCGSWDYNCALSVDGETVCFGERASVEILSGPRVALDRISCGGNHACGVTPDHQIVCWGQVGHGEEPPRE